MACFLMRFDAEGRCAEFTETSWLSPIECN